MVGGHPLLGSIAQGLCLWLAAAAATWALVALDEVREEDHGTFDLYLAITILLITGCYSGTLVNVTVELPKLENPFVTPLTGLIATVWPFIVALIPVGEASRPTVSLSTDELKAT